VASVQGVRSNQLQGLGLVIGQSTHSPSTRIRIATVASPRPLSSCPDLWQV